MEIGVVHQRKPRAGRRANPTHPLAPSAYWILSEGGGAVARDVMGRVSPLALTTSWADIPNPGKKGIQSTSTSGDQFAAGAVPAWLSGLTGDVTYLGWINYASLPTAADTIPFNSIIGFADYQFNPGVLGADDTRLTWGCAAAFTTYRTSISYTLSTGVWYCIGAIRRGSTIEWYVNGVQVGTAAQVGSAAADSAGSFELLGGGAFREAQATLAHAGVWARALPVPAMMRLYQQPFCWMPANVWRRMLVPAPAGGTLYTQTISAASAASPVLVRQANKILSASSAEAASMVRDARRTLSAAQAESAVLARQPQVIRNAAQAESAAIATLRTAHSVLAAAAAGGASLVKQAQVIRSAAAGESAALVKQPAKVVSAADGETAILSRQTSTSLSAAEGETGTVVRQPRKTISAGTAESGSVVRQPNKLLGAASSALAVLVQSVRIIRSAGQGETGTVATGTHASIVLSAATSAIAAIVRLPGLVRSATAGGTASLTRQMQKLLTSVQSEGAGIVRDGRRTLAAAAPASPSVTRRVSRTLAATCSGAASLLAALLNAGHQLFMTVRGAFGDRSRRRGSGDGYRRGGRSDGSDRGGGVG